MPRCYAYIRVSTVKQGEKGVSLQEQHAAITRYAERCGLDVVQWFEERVTAAKLGRPLFAQMLRQLKKGNADGVIIHKIDRGARNLRDWAEIADLNDLGIAVHFANESVDLQTRGGRLSADIQAVVAADYVRNLREETLKGMYGRLKQGISPFKAPLGYLDKGGGRIKEIDPVRGPLIRQAFELYASGRFGLESLLAELHRLGLRNNRGSAVSVNGLSTILNNPFYTGLIHVKTTNETFQGRHPALISMALFKNVGARLKKRVPIRTRVHDFPLRGLFTCSLCNRHLCGEMQKGHVYYRCHTKSCPTLTFREEVLESAMLNAWPPIARTEEEKLLLLEHVEAVIAEDHQGEAERLARLQVQIGGVKTRMNRLVDAFLDGTLDKHSFEARRTTLLEEQQSLEASLRSRNEDTERIKAGLAEMFELVSTAQQSYRIADPYSRREMAIRLCSNRTVAAKEVSIEPFFPLRALENSPTVTESDPIRGRIRTYEQVARELWEWAKKELGGKQDLDSEISGRRAVS